MNEKLIEALALAKNMLMNIQVWLPADGIFDWNQFNTDFQSIAEALAQARQPVAPFAWTWEYAGDRHFRTTKPDFEGMTIGGEPVKVEPVYRQPQAPIGVELAEAEKVINFEIRSHLGVPMDSIDVMVRHNLATAILEKLLALPQTKKGDDENDYVAWLRWNGHTFRTCDSDSKGAFKVWRRPPQDAGKVKP